MAQLMPLPLTVSCSSKSQIGFTFLVPAYPGCPGKEAVKWLLLLVVQERIRPVKTKRHSGSVVARAYQQVTARRDRLVGAYSDGTQHHLKSGCGDRRHVYISS